MSSVLQILTVRRLLAATLLIAAIIAAIVVWVDRRGPSAVVLDNLSGEEVLILLEQRHGTGGREICGEDMTANIQSTGVVAHGLDSTSEVPAEVVAAIAEFGANLEDHEHRHFDTHRLLLISWDPTSIDLGEGYGAELGSIYELHYLEDETSIGWGVAYSGTIFECPPDWPD